MGADRSTCRGVLTPSPYPSSLAERTLRRQIPKVGARCVKYARRDLCGGCSVMSIPTAIIPTKVRKATRNLQAAENGSRTLKRARHGSKAIVGEEERPAPQENSPPKARAR